MPKPTIEIVIGPEEKTIYCECYQKNEECHVMEEIIKNKSLYIKNKKRKK
jgi:hypothetical protein